MVGTEEELIRAMVAIGWYPANSITFESSLRIVVDSVLRRPDDQAPVSSLYLFGRKQDLAFEQPVGNSPRQRHHIRFWRSAEREDNRPLWFGAATFDRSVGLSHTTGEVTHHIGPDVDAERDRIAKQLAGKNWVQEEYWENHFHKAAGRPQRRRRSMAYRWKASGPRARGPSHRLPAEQPRGTVTRRYLLPHLFSPMPRIEAVKKTHFR